jgi:hypothetical protein
MAKYTVAADRFAYGHYGDGDPVDGKPQRVWLHTWHVRGSTIELSEKDAERHLADGTITKPSDFVADVPASKATDDVGGDTSAKK